MEEWMGVVVVGWGCYLSHKNGNNGRAEEFYFPDIFGRNDLRLVAKNSSRIG